MAEYIKREDVLEFSRIFADKLWETGGYRNCITEAVPVKTIKNIPSADVAEVRHGEWISIGESDSNGNAQYECSNCHAGDEHAVNVEVPYCWKCGARMDGKDINVATNEDYGT